MPRAGLARGHWGALRANKRAEAEAERGLEIQQREVNVRSRESRFAHARSSHGLESFERFETRSKIRRVTFLFSIRASTDTRLDRPHPPPRL